MNPQILLVSNYETLRFLMADALSMIDADVIECPTAHAALLALEALESNQSFDLVLTDICMRGALNGLQLAQIIGVRWPRIPVILSSGNMQVPVQEVPVNVAFLPKPWTLDQLLNLVRQHLQITSQADVTLIDVNIGQRSPDDYER